MNFYNCPSCNECWQDLCSFACNDLCPRCRRVIAPLESVSVAPCFCRAARGKSISVGRVLVRQRQFPANGFAEPVPVDAPIAEIREQKDAVPKKRRYPKNPRKQKLIDEYQQQLRERKRQSRNALRKD